MSLQDVKYWLPGTAQARGSAGARAAAGAGIAALGAGEVQRVWQALDTAAASWRRHDLGARVEIVARLASALRGRGPAAWRDALVPCTGLSAAGLDAAWDATFAPFDARSLRAALRAERMWPSLPATADSAPHAPPRRTRPPRRIVHVLSGNVLPPTFSMLVRGWLLGAAQWLRPAARESVFACCIAECLPELAPPLDGTFAVLWWPHDDATLAPAVLSGAEVVTVQGDDDSVAAVRDRVTREAPAARCIGYGSRWSLAVVSAASQTRATARALAWDIVLHDQRGCLSPSLVLAEGGAALPGWCGELADALADLERRLPRGFASSATRAGLRAWRESMRLGLVLGDVAHLWESRETSAWAVALLATCRVVPSPLERHLAVAPFTAVDEIGAALGGAVRPLQGLAAALEGWSEEKTRTLIRMLNPAHTAAPGMLQAAPPSWRQDHRAPFAALFV